MSSIVTTRRCRLLHRFLEQQNTTYMLQIWTHIARLWHFCPLLVMLVVCFALTLTCTATAKTSINRHSRKKNVLLTPPFILWRCDPTRVMASSFLRFLDHIQRRNTVGRTPLDEWSARRRDLYLIHTAITTDKYPCPRWDSNPQSQQAGGRRPTS